MAQRHSIVTVAGRNKEAQKTANNEAIIFTHIALGDGQRYPFGGETELENEVHRGAISGSGTEAAEPNAVWFDLYVPANVNTFYVQEIGLFDEDGVLYALARFDQAVPKFGPDSTSLSDGTFRVVVVFADTENINVTLSPVAGLTPDNLPAHLPLATKLQRGIVELATEVEAMAGLDDERAITAKGLAAHVAEKIAALPEDQKLTVEEVQDIVAAFIAATGASIIYDDAGNALTIDVEQATELVLGIVRLATLAEATAGTSTTTAVTPKGVDAHFRSNIKIGNYARGVMINMYPDAGRMADEAVGLGVTEFVPPDYLQLANDVTMELGGKYINNNATYGGTGAALNAEADAFVSSFKSPANRRYGPEFNFARILVGAGTIDAQTEGGVTRYFSLFQGFTQVPSFFTASCRIIVKNQSIMVRRDGGATLIKNGVAQTGNVVITPEDGVVHIVNQGVYANGVKSGYQMQPIYIYAEPNTEFFVALPAMMSGIVDVPVDAGIIPSIYPKKTLPNNGVGTLVNDGAGNIFWGIRPLIYNHLGRVNSGSSAIYTKDLAAGEMLVFNAVSDSGYTGGYTTVKIEIFGLGSPNPYITLASKTTDGGSDDQQRAVVTYTGIVLNKKLYQFFGNALKYVCDVPNFNGTIKLSGGSGWGGYQSYLEWGILS